jgi:hypothetical protein
MDVPQTLFLFCIALAMSAMLIHLTTRPKIRDYYAARAPKMPEWFKPDLSKAPVSPPVIREYVKAELGDAALAVYTQYYNDEDLVWQYTKEHGDPNSVDFRRDILEFAADDYSVASKELKDFVADLEAKWETYHGLKAEYDEIEKHEQITQWPFYYADSMISAREQ